MIAGRRLWRSSSKAAHVAPACFRCPPRMKVANCCRNPENVAVEENVAVDLENLDVREVLAPLLLIVFLLCVLF